MPINRGSWRRSSVAGVTTTVARLGELVDAALLPGFVALDSDQRVGLLTYVERADGIEVPRFRRLSRDEASGER